MDNFEGTRDELFQKKTGGDELPKGWQFEELSEAVQHSNLKTLARVVIEIGGDGAPKVEKSMEEIEKRMEVGDNKIVAKMESEGKYVARMEIEKKENCWTLAHRFCQPAFRGRMIMTELLGEVEEMLKEKGVAELRMNAVKVSPACWALKRGFEIGDAEERQDTYETLRARGWSGDAQEYLDMEVELVKKLD